MFSTIRSIYHGRQCVRDFPGCKFVYSELEQKIGKKANFDRALLRLILVVVAGLERGVIQ